MKFLLVTLGSIGDFMPFLAIGEALRGRGHVVMIAANANYAPLARMAGFEFAPIWNRPDSQAGLDSLLDSNPGEAWQRVRRDMFVPATGPTYEVIMHQARRGDCVVLASWNAFGARQAHDAHGIPLCSIYLSPHALTEDDNPLPAGSPHAGAIGLYPSWFSAPERHGDATPTGFVMLDDALVPALPADLEQFLNAGPAPLIFTPGSFMRRSAHFFRESAAVCEDLGLRGVFLTPHSDQIPASLPAGIIHFKYVSLQRLAPRSVALVHHGGIGTAAQAMKAGIPHLVTPVFFDQFDNAARIMALCIGSQMERYERSMVASKLAGLLDSPTVRNACQGIRARFGGPGPASQICRIAEALA